MGENRAGFRMPDHTQPLTARDVEELRQQGYEDGFAEGKNAGYQAGLEEGRAAMQEQLELELTKIRQLIQAMQKPFQGFRTVIVTELKATTRDICESFLRHKMTSDTQLLDFLVDESVQQLLPSQHQIVVHVNQHNSEVVQKALKNHVEDEAWRLQINNKLSDGNVFLESGHARVKLDLDAMLAQYLVQLSQIDSPPGDA